jgi:tetratricopeptide (TPR) repeat protein
VGDASAQTQFATSGATYDESTTSPADPDAVNAALEQDAEPTRLDRYLLVERIGQGSFATVWAAYDPQLDRRVAIKLLHHRSDEENSLGPEELSNQLAEAQALAQLSHPNVVAVHDVQEFSLRTRGEVLAGVFIVMEFLAGDSLRDWMKRERPWREVLAVFIEAGKGLAAAHERGLIHRDFKPSNVMFGDQGRIRVLDFGLASTGAEIRRRSLDRSSENRSRVVGTPAYMAPEQHLDAEIDARSDQFAFCVALYEALYNQRPFSGETRAELGTAKLRGEILPPPRSASVPAWVHAIVLRGLAPDPGDRFAGMTDLLEALDRDPSQSRRRWAIGALVAALIAGSGYGLAQVNEETPPNPCVAPERDLEGVWGESVQREIQQSFMATGLPYAEEAYDRVRLALDTHTSQWAKLHVEICEATVVRAEQPYEVMGEQMMCLQRRLRRVAGLTSALKQADAATVARAGDTVLALEPPKTCRSAVPDERREQPDDARRAKLLEVEGEVARVGVLNQLGRYEEAITTADSAIERALELSDPGGAGRAALARSRALWYLGRYDESVAASEQALRWAALAADEETEAMAQIRLIRAYTALGKYDVAEAVAKLAGALVEDGRLGKDVEAWHDLFTAILYGRQQRWEEALAKLEHGLALRRELYGPDHPELAPFHNTYGNTLLKQGEDFDGALEHYREARRLWETNFGPQYPDVASVNNNIGAIYLSRGEPDEARAYFERALAGFELTIGSDNPQLISTLVNLGVIANLQGRLHDALALFQRARDIAVAKVGEDNVRTAEIDIEIARVLISLDELARAEELLEHALKTERRENPDNLTALLDATNLVASVQHERGELEAWRGTLAAMLEQIAELDHGHYFVAWDLYLRAQLAHETGELEAALELAEQYLARLTEEIGPDNVEIVSALALVLDLLLELDQPEAAATRARQALEISKMAPTDRQRWVLEYQLGRAEAARGRREAASEELERALERTTGPAGNPRRAALVARELAPLVKATDPKRAAELRELAAAAAPTR